MSTEVKIVHDKTFETIRSAVNKMVDFIRPTFGPASNKVIIDKQAYRMIVDDGVQIARDFELTDPAEQAVVKIVRETLIKTNDREGDGTTGAAITLQSIINEVSRYGHRDGRKIERELKMGLEEAKAQLLKSKKTIKTKEDLKKVALVSHDNEEIAEMLADLYFKLGQDAVITVDKHPLMKTEVESAAGITWPNGYISPYMVNNPERLDCVLENPYILITDYRLTEDKDILPIMNKLAQAGNAEGKRKALMVIAENVEQNALATMVINLPQVFNPNLRAPGQMPAVAIVAPKVDQRDVVLNDIAIKTGGKFFAASQGFKLEDVNINDLGRADKVIVRKDETIIVGPRGKKSDIEKAVYQLKKTIEQEKDERKNKFAKQRLGMFTDSIAIVKVGAATENEQKALKYKVEDTVNSMRSAFRSGVVCGAGWALYNIKTSSHILNEALKYPHRQLLENMGLSEYFSKPEHVTNLVTGKTGHYLDVGVVDPVDVLIAGLESAVSIACVLITSTGILVEHQKEEKQNG